MTLQGDVYDWEADTTILEMVLIPPYSQLQDDFYLSSGGNVLGRWTHTLSPTSILDLQFYYDHTSMDLAGLGEKRHTVDWDFQHRFLLGSVNEVLWGVGYRQTRDEIQNGDMYLFQPTRRKDHLTSFFVQDNLRLIPERLTVTVGSKFEHLVFSYPGSTPDYRKFTLQPNLRLLWNVNDTNTIWAAVSRAVRNPSRADHDIQLNWLVLPPGDPDNPVPFPIQFSVFGSRLLEPESLRSHELGFRTQIHDQVSLDLAGFYNSYSDLRGGAWGEPSLEMLPTLHVSVPNTIANEFSATTYGFEASARWWVTPRWLTRWGYSFLDVDAASQLIEIPALDPRLNEFLDAAALGDAPPHQVFLASAWTLNGAFSLDLDFRWIDEFSDIDSYADLNARLAWRLAESAEVSIVGQNLLQPSHREFRRDFLEVRTQVERGLYSKLVWEF